MQKNNECSCRCHKQPYFVHFIPCSCGSPNEEPRTTGLRTENEMTVIKINETRRISTGPIQFGEDWPGYFIRGDDAGGLCDMLDWAIKVVKEVSAQERDKFAAVGKLLHKLQSDLETCQVDPKNWKPSRK